MSIVSLHFWIFAAAVTLLYFLIPKKWQWVVILCGNLYFYAQVGIKWLLLLALTSLITWFVALRLDTGSQVSASLAGVADRKARSEAKKKVQSLRKFICGTGIVLALGVWVLLKYTDFFLGTYNRLISVVQADWSIPLRGWVLPLGMSFYTFHIVGYVVDIYRGKYPAERNFARYFAFVSFFPHMIQGPFTRFGELGRSILAPHDFDWDRMVKGLMRILWGMFQKMVIADRLSIAVQTVFGQFRDYTGTHVLFMMAIYGIQLYADFAGYMDIVCGLSGIWGIELPENFQQPYFSRSIDEFWRRWHITLGAWFRDYLFYPISMGKLAQKISRFGRKKWGPEMGKLLPGYFAMFFVWTATGLWHGASWHYLIWGYLNMLAIMGSMQFAGFFDRTKQKLHINSEGWAWRLFSMIRTFVLICLIRFFSLIPGAGEALRALGHVVIHPGFSGMDSLGTLFPGLQSTQVVVILGGVLAMLTLDILREAGAWEKVREKCPAIVRCLLCAVMIILMVLMAGGSSDLTRGFMYANF